MVVVFGIPGIHGSGSHSQGTKGLTSPWGGVGRGAALPRPALSAARLDRLGGAQAPVGIAHTQDAPTPPPPATWSRSHERTVGLCASSHEGTRGHAAASLGALGTASARASARCHRRRGHTDYAQASPRNSITVSGKLRSRKRAMALAPNCRPTPHPHTT